MTVLQLGSNRTQVHTETDELGEITILYSYTTPVALKVLRTQEVYRTSAWFSKTTTRHINKWLEFTPESQINQMSQPNIEAMIK